MSLFADPPNGTVVDTYPATFSCDLGFTSWFIDDISLNQSLSFDGSVQISFEITDGDQSNITIIEFSLGSQTPPPLPPQTVTLSCGTFLEGQGNVRVAYYTLVGKINKYS